MSSPEYKFDHESMQDAQAVADYLKALGAAFAEGGIVLGSGEKSFELAPGRLVKLEIEARRRGERNRVDIKVSWRAPELKAARTGNDTLVINAGPGAKGQAES